MNKKNPYLFYPPIVYESCETAEQIAQLDIDNQLYFDHEAAGLLDTIADADRICWSDIAHSTRCRRILRMIAAHLRGESW